MDRECESLFHEMITEHRKHAVLKQEDVETSCETKADDHVDTTSTMGPLLIDSLVLVFDSTHTLLVHGAVSLSLHLATTQQRHAQKGDSHFLGVCAMSVVLLYNLQNGDADGSYSQVFLDFLLIDTVYYLAKMQTTSHNTNEHITVIKIARSASRLAETYRSDSHSTKPDWVAETMALAQQTTAPYKAKLAISLVSPTTTTTTTTTSTSPPDEHRNYQHTRQYARYQPYHNQTRPIRNGFSSSNNRDTARYAPRSSR